MNQSVSALLAKLAWLIFGLCVGSLIVWGILVAKLDVSCFEKRDAIVQECLASEQYTREECILLAGGEK